ncbi:MAG: lysoplasmalogenase family protein [Defluviitaleaceae bacterium]|nr:lysoplasmalogenase family protein [Defluviitaleaceae bacterium]
MTMELKFAFVAGCFALALLSYFRCNSKNDWAWLVGGLAFTLGADYFLVLHNNHLHGIAVFCFTHVCYIMRADSHKNSVNVYTLIARFGIVSAFVVVAVINDSVAMLAGIYAILFAVNIHVNFRFFRNEKTPIPKLNRALILAGLILFILCDINVLLFNLPMYLNAPQGLTAVFPLIWVFYLPSQALLAVSAINYKKTPFGRTGRQL